MVRPYAPVVLAVMLGAVGAGAQTLYAIGGVTATEEALATIDTATASGSFVDVNELFDVGSTGTALACDGTLWGFSLTDATTGELYTVDLASGRLSFVQTITRAAGAPDFGNGIGFAFAADGQAVLVNDFHMYRLELATAAAAHVGAIGNLSSFQHFALTLAPDCSLVSMGEDITGIWRYVSIDPATAGVTSLGSNREANLTAIEFDAAGRLWATRLSQLLELDPVDGALLQVAGDVGFSVPGLALDLPSSCLVAPVVTIAPVAAICAGDAITVDAAGSTACGAAALSYRVRDGASVLCDWSPAPDCSYLPPASTTLTVDAACGNAPGGCVASADVAIEVVAPPVAAAGDDASVCELEGLLLDGSASGAGGCTSLLYEWRDGATVVRPFDPDPSFAAPTTTAATTTYTLVVLCAGPAACSSSDEVEVEVRACNFAVTFDHHAARIVDGGDGPRVCVEWRTEVESGSVGYSIERGERRDGPFRPLAWLSAAGPGFAYRWCESAAATPARYYQIVEYTVDGRGDVSPALTPRRDGPRAGRARSGLSRRGR